MIAFLILLGIMLVCLLVCILGQDGMGVAIFGVISAVMLLGLGVDGLLHLFGAVA